MNEVFETIAEVFEELRSESGEREYSVQTKESEKADKKLKKANREYEKLLTEISAEHKEFLEDYICSFKGEREEVLKHDIEAKVWSEKNLTKCVAVTQGDEAYL